VEGAYVRNNSNDSMKAIFTAIDFVLLPTFKLVFFSKMIFWVFKDQEI